ncbi:hypothetical protein VTJ49DRAFT_409 [Mycothermus thermophilus]|uniref:Uncharacterized protein n=1 Tax=Humicola insolens TaxID=85995 RepID=A0ABR3VHC3_HUMIN
MTHPTTHPHPGLTRIRLSNGYRAYCPASAAPPPRANKPEKRVRFVKGFVTEPTTLREPSPPGFAGPGARKIDASFLEKEQQQYQQPQSAAPQGRTRRTSPSTGGRYMEGPSGPAVWRKEPRYRAKETLPVVDDSVWDEEMLAKDGVGLPCDRWREPVTRRGVRVGVVRGSDGDSGDDGIERKGEMELGGMERLRYEDGERAEGFSLRDIAGDEEVVAVRVVEKPSRRRKVKVEEEDWDMEWLEEEIESLEEEVFNPLTDGESDDGESLPDLCAEEPLGWVLVMEVEEVEGEDWMSLSMAWKPVVMVGEEKK